MDTGADGIVAQIIIVRVARELDQIAGGEGLVAVGVEPAAEISGLTLGDDDGDRQGDGCAGDQGRAERHAVVDIRLVGGVGEFSGTQVQVGHHDIGRLRVTRRRAVVELVWGEAVGEIVGLC